jgi:hypothetical protein
MHNSKLFLMNMIQNKNHHFMKLQLTIIALCMAIISHAAIKTPCAKIVLNNGRVIEAEILELTPIEVRYKKCGQTTNVEYILPKESITVIKNHQDEVLFVHKKSEIESLVNDSEKDYEVTGIVALIMLALSPVLALPFGLLSRYRIKRAPNKYKSRSKMLADIAIYVSLGMIALVLLLFFSISNLGR